MRLSGPSDRLERGARDLVLTDEKKFRMTGDGWERPTRTGRGVGMVEPYTQSTDTTWRGGGYLDMGQASDRG